MRNTLTLYLLVLGLISFQQSYAQKYPSLNNENLSLQWKKTSSGFALQQIQIKNGKNKLTLEQPLGEYTYLYSTEKPSNKPLLNEVSQRAQTFPDSSYGHIFNRWKNSLAAVPLNLAGTAVEFFPSESKQRHGDQITFSHETDQAFIKANWKLDPNYKSDILVSLQLTAKKDGYFSIASPTLATVPEESMSWAMVPGYFQGNALEPDLVLSYGYGQGIPDRPVVLRERAASTLSPLISAKQGYTMAVIPEPGQGRDPWENNSRTQNEWKLGLSVMNRKNKLSPVVYHPVLGEKGSFIKKGDTLNFRFRYTVQATDWYPVYKHAINDIYRFPDFLKLKDTKESLSSRFLALAKYVQDDSISMWNIQSYQNLKIGAQDYLSSVYDKDDDAMKNSDYGAMWMLANITDSSLKEKRLPYARNFKIAQQEEKPGFFQGAAKGQYYLWKSKRFVEEWGNYVEPIGLTYYVMLDIGNILLFNPEDTVLRKRLRLGADKLMDWQHLDGHWEVAYDRETETPLFQDVKDLRPTFYGLVVAKRILGDDKYLQAARKGADWFIKNAVDKGDFLGVCGDFRFAPDFATGQSVQALLDLYDLTKAEHYKDAAIKVARLYTTYIYTHPIPDRSKKEVDGIEREDWEISQVGSRFEQGGLLGSANSNGPILLASHAGMFVRLYELTQDSLYINMARAAAWGQDAFVNPQTKVQSYYWKSMNAGVGRYPHHAWWQIGWMTDYLLAEIKLRSHGKINFPRGFVTPKVGPHQTYGFAPGQIFSKPAKLSFPDGAFTLNNQRIDYFGALNESSKTLYVILLNNSDKKQQTKVFIDPKKIASNNLIVFNTAELLDQDGNQIKKFMNSKDYEVEIPAYGLRVIQLKF